MTYHPKLGTKTVNNAEEEKALGRGWVNNPNEFPEEAQVVKHLHPREAGLRRNPKTRSYLTRDIGVLAGENPNCSRCLTQLNGMPWHNFSKSKGSGRAEFEMFRLLNDRASSPIEHTLVKVLS